jgi:hypothetical protein
MMRPMWMVLMHSNRFFGASSATRAQYKILTITIAPDGGPALSTLAEMFASTCRCVHLYGYSDRWLKKPMLMITMWLRRPKLGENDAFGGAV